MTFKHNVKCKYIHIYIKLLSTFVERAEKVPAAAQDAQRDVQQGGGDDEEAAQEVARGEQERPRHGQGAQEHADPRGREVQARRLLRAEPEKCTSDPKTFSCNPSRLPSVILCAVALSLPLRADSTVDAL